MNGGSVSASAGRTMWALFSQIGRSSSNCLHTSATKACPTVEVASASPRLRVLKLNRTSEVTASTGTAAPMSRVSTMPLKRVTAKPGPWLSTSMRPSTTPRGVGNFCTERIRDRVPSVS